jgi:hypothetical protein
MDCHWLGRFLMKPRPLRIDPDLLHRAAGQAAGALKLLANEGRFP